MSRRDKNKPGSKRGCAPANNHVPGSFATASRQQQVHQRFIDAFAAVKERHGHGAYSYAEGMTRRAARRIARKISRRKALGATA